MKRLYRSEKDKKIGGICAGLGEYMDVDPTVIRLAAIVLGLVTAVVPFIIGYIIAWWIIPAEFEVNRETTTQQQEHL